jgi:hypothetical protein
MHQVIAPIALRRTILAPSIKRISIGWIDRYRNARSARRSGRTGKSSSRSQA